jgi:hypothetical protein
LSAGEGERTDDRGGDGLSFLSSYAPSDDAQANDANAETNTVDRNIVVLRHRTFAQIIGRRCKAKSSA